MACLDETATLAKRSKIEVCMLCVPNSNLKCVPKVLCMMNVLFIVLSRNELT